MRRGTRVGQAYIAVTADGSGINDDIVDSVDEAGDGVGRVGEKHGERYGDGFSEGFFARMRGKFNKRFSSSFGDTGDESGREFTDRFERHFDNGFLDRLGARVGGHLVDAINFAISKEGGSNPLSDLFDRTMDDGHADRTGERYASHLLDGIEKRILAGNLGLILANSVSGNGRNRGGLSDVIGRMFGAGSRNNFLNFMGKRLGNIVSLTEKASQFATGFAKGMSDAAEGAGIVRKVMAGFSGGAGASGLAGAFSKIAASGTALIPVAVVVLGTLSAMASVVGALIGIVTALAATIASALTGALIVLGGAIAAVTAGAGLLTAAFMSMTDAQQNALKNAFQPLKAEMVGIGQIMLRDMVPAFSTWSANLQKALLLAVPVAQVMGKAFADAGNILTRSFSGPGFQNFANALGVWLPSITTRLSKALGGFLNGLLGVFSALMPMVNQFAGYLARVADRFSTWANSAAGQNSIVDFTNRAVESLKSLWNFIGSFSGFLSKVLFSPEAQNAGNTIFDKLADKFQSFTQKVAQAQADGSLKRWFDDAIKFGGQLWGVIEALGGTFMSLYNAGVLDAVGRSLEVLANIINAMNTLLTPLINSLGKGLPAALTVMLTPINIAAQGIIKVGEALQWVGEMAGLTTQKIGTAVETSKGLNSLLNNPITSLPTPLSTSPLTGNPTGSSSGPDLSSIISLGNTALAGTNIPKTPKAPKKWKNPWKQWANSLIKDGPSVSAQIKNAVLSVNKSVASGLSSASQSTDSGSVVSSLDSLMSSITTTGESTVNTAQSAVNSAASTLANATSKKSAKAALKKVKAAQKDLKAALSNQERINNAAAILNAHKVVSEGNVVALINGLAATNITLADYAEARSRVAVMLDEANQKLTEALSLRDDYKKQVSDSIRDFGSLLTTQASVIDGVEQALTASDITSNLQARLDKIKTFQSNLRLLLAQGLSDAAYKQIVDAGVDEGSTLATALLNGGNGAIQNVNSLVGQINGIADTLGSETSSRLYQAGVDAAQGLVDGLTSLSAQLDAAAYSLGLSIAAAVKSALGIASPSRVLRAMMGDVGDGAVLGLGDQEVKVGSAAARLASKIAVSPVAASAPNGGSVSGNEQRPINIDLDINTPTEDPKAVANEAINELVGRL